MSFQVRPQRQPTDPPSCLVGSLRCGTRFSNGRFAGYDSPELATRVRNTATVATWRVAAGGRIGMVVGEDAVEGGCRP